MRQPQEPALEVGGCYDHTNNEIISCAADESLCVEMGKLTTNDVSFKTHDDIGRDKSLSHIKCTSDQLPVGMCRSVKQARSGLSKQCAFSRKSCDLETTYTPAADYLGCSVHGTFHSGIFIPTQYGACRDKDGELRCVLSLEDCTNGEDYEEWLRPSQVLREEATNTKEVFGCRCNDVRVGVCVAKDYLDYELTKEENSKCAIDSSECNPFLQDWKSVRDILADKDLKVRYDYCRLCPYTNMIQEPTHFFYVISSKDSFTSAEMFGLAMGVIITCLVLLFLCQCWRIRKKPEVTGRDLQLAEEDQENQEQRNPSFLRKEDNRSPFKKVNLNDSADSNQE